MLYCFIMPLPPQALAGGWERERSPLKKISLRRSPQPEEAPQRIPWPDYAPTAETGLSSAQAAELLSGGWGNEAVASPTKSDRQIVRENVVTDFNLIFIILAVCLLVVGDWKDMSFLLIVAANTGTVACLMPMVIGICAGILSTVGFSIIAPKVCKLIRGTDTCGVHNLHGMPGLLGGLFAIAITGNVGVQVGAVVCTVVVGLGLGRICGAILGLFGTKEDTYSDESDFILEED